MTHISPAVPPKLWRRFNRAVPSWNLEAERDHEETYYRLTIYALYWPKGYEIVGKNVATLMRRVLRDGKTNYHACKKAWKAGDKRSIADILGWGEEVRDVIVL